ncbi:hypothetical protein VEx25_2075, partial [Vibrio antiquarius]
ILTFWHCMMQKQTLTSSSTKLKRAICWLTILLTK